MTMNFRARQKRQTFQSQLDATYWIIMIKGNSRKKLRSQTNHYFCILFHIQCYSAEIHCTTFVSQGLPVLGQHVVASIQERGFVGIDSVHKYLILPVVVTVIPLFEASSRWEGEEVKDYCNKSKHL